MKNLLICFLLFIGIILPINSFATENKTVEFFKIYKELINNCMQADLTLNDGKPAICFPSFGKSKADAYKNMFRYQSLLGIKLSTKTTWVTTGSGFTFQKKQIKDKAIVTYIDMSWDGCGEIGDITYCEFRLVQDYAENNKVAHMISFEGMIESLKGK